MYGRNNSISLDKLLTYGDIYGLGITQKDVDHLELVFKAYQGVGDFYYCYKLTASGHYLELNLPKSMEEIGSISVRKAPEWVTKETPALFRVGDTYFSFLPNTDDLIHIPQLCQYDRLFDDEKQSPHIYATIQEFKTNLLSNLEEISRAYSGNNNVTINIIRALFWAAGQRMPKLDWPEYGGHYKNLPPYIAKIISVLQLPDDSRLSFYYYNRGGERYFDPKVRGFMSKPGDRLYNWMDEGRFCSHFVAENDRLYPTVIYSEQHALLPKEGSIVDAYKRGQEFVTIDNTVLDTLIKRHARRTQEQENERAAIKALESKLKTKIQELDDGHTFTYNDMDFTKDSITYEGQCVISKDVIIKNVLSEFAGNYSEDHLNFERVFSTWVTKFVSAAVANQGAATANVGDVTIHLEHTRKAAKDGVRSSFYYVNAQRINKEEVADVISRAICFPTTEDFTRFCEIVASCSLKYHKLLASGLRVSAKDELLGQRMTFKIQLERESRKNYVVIDGKRYKVSDTNRLLTLANADGMTRVYDVLLDKKVVGLSGMEINKLLAVGKQALENEKKREEELLQQTMALFNITEVPEFRVRNGNTISGYLVRGAKRDYVVEKNKLLVYEHPTGRYICMVDKGQNEHTNVARLVNRFYALSNDSRLAQEITTL